jgi:hypothetical protein
MALVIAELHNITFAFEGGGRSEKRREEKRREEKRRE